MGGSSFSRNTEFELSEKIHPGGSSRRKPANSPAKCNSRAKVITLSLNLSCFAAYFHSHKRFKLIAFILEVHNEWNRGVERRGRTTLCKWNPGRTVAVASADCPDKCGDTSHHALRNRKSSSVPIPHRTWRVLFSKRIGHLANGSEMTDCRCPVSKWRRLVSGRKRVPVDSWSEIDVEVPLLIWPTACCVTLPSLLPSSARRSNKLSLP